MSDHSEDAIESQGYPEDAHWGSAEEWLSPKRVKTCPICGTKYKGETFRDPLRAAVRKVCEEMREDAARGDLIGPGKVDYWAAALERAMEGK